MWLKGCFPQTEVKSRKTKENRIFHLRENGPHSSDEGNPYMKTNLHTRCLRKIANKWGTQIASWTHIYMVFSVVWTGNQQCSVPHCLAIFGTTLYLSLIKPMHGQNVSLWIPTKSPPLSNSRPPSNFQKSNPDIPANVFELIPGGCPGGMYPVGNDWDVTLAYTVQSSYTRKTCEASCTEVILHTVIYLQLVLQRHCETSYEKNCIVQH